MTVKENETKTDSALALEIKGSLAKISDELKAAGEKAIAEAKSGVEMAAKTKENVDEMLVVQGALTERLGQLEQKAARRGADETLEAKSLGERFVDTEEYKAFAKQRPGRGHVNMNVKTINTITSTTSGTGAAGAAVRNDRVQGWMTPGLQQFTIRDLMSPGRTISNMIEYVQETGFQNSAAPQAGEGSAKAQSDITFALVQQAVVTLAHYVKASKQILDDSAMMESYINTRLIYGLKLVEEAQLLNGSSSTNNLNGIYTQATAYALPSGGYGGGAVAATEIDIIRMMILQAELALYPVDGIVLNNASWANIETVKDSQGRYIVGNPQDILGPRLWGRPVVPTISMANGKALVGAFKMGSQIFDREDANVQVSTEDSTNFTSNLVTIRAEERLASAVFRPAAFIKGTINANV